MGRRERPGHGQARLETSSSHAAKEGNRPDTADTGRLGRRRESRDEQEKRMRARLGWRLGWGSRGQRAEGRGDLPDQTGSDEWQWMQRELKWSCWRGSGESSGE